MLCSCIDCKHHCYGIKRRRQKCDGWVCSGHRDVVIRKIIIIRVKRFALSAAAAANIILAIAIQTFNQTECHDICITGVRTIVCGCPPTSLSLRSCIRCGGWPSGSLLGCHLRCRRFCVGCFLACLTRLLVRVPQTSTQVNAKSQ